MNSSAAPSIDASAQRLVETVRAYGPVAVALSGGVDSSVVAKAAALALANLAVAITADSPSVAEGELESARKIAGQVGIRHQVIQTREFDNPQYVRNDGSRCYHCKSELYDRVLELRAKLGFEVICSGANLDDLGDYRPGLKAAAERHIRHPLQEAGFTKSMVRELARFWELPNAEKPAAPCLASRIAIGVEATPERTRRIDLAERFLRGLGLTELRVRYHPGDHARIEIPVEQLPRLIEPAVRVRLVDHFEELGFQFVSLDLEGFRSGALNVLVPAEMLAGSMPGPFPPSKTEG